MVRALDSRWAGREFDSHAAAALSGNNLGQVVHTNVPLFTKLYNLVPCEGFHVYAPVCGSIMGPMNKGSIVVAVLQRSFV